MAAEFNQDYAALLSERGMLLKEKMELEQQLKTTHQLSEDLMKVLESTREDHEVEIVKMKNVVI